jgi:hypothetical protein
MSYFGLNANQQRGVEQNVDYILCDPEAHNLATVSVVMSSCMKQYLALFTIDSLLLHIHTYRSVREN